MNQSVAIVTHNRRSIKVYVIVDRFHQYCLISLLKHEQLLRESCFPLLCVDYMGNASRSRCGTRIEPHQMLCTCKDQTITLELYKK